MVSCEFDNKPKGKTSSKITNATIVHSYLLVFWNSLCFIYLCSYTFGKEISMKIALDVLSFPGGLLLMLCAYKGNRHVGSDMKVSESGLYDPLKW